MMRILILGSGGRECTFAWKLSNEIPKENIFIAPGNAGTSAFGTNVNLSILDFKAIGLFCLENQINVLLPGGEDSLVAGIRDYFEANSELKPIYVFGPNQSGAALEGSKDFAKRFMKKYDIPTAAYQAFHKGETNEAKAFLGQMKAPYVIKADGLAAGKGVVILDNLKEAEECVENMLDQGQFGEASHTIVIEEFLDGIEVSFFALTNGNDYCILPEAKDYKRIGEGDKGLNTGGMGAVSPVTFIDEVFRKKVFDKIISPTMNGLKQENMNYRGFVFFGLIAVNGEPFVIEYNCRMGDPETEVVLPRLENKLSDLIEYSMKDQLAQIKMQFKNEYCSTVMLVSGGYPEAYKKNKIIDIKNTEGSMVFHSGTAMKEGNLVTSGGRVLAISSYGDTLMESLEKSYKTIKSITFEGINYRKDIGQDLIRQFQNQL